MNEKPPEVNLWEEEKKELEYEEDYNENPLEEIKEDPDRMSKEIPQEGKLVEEKKITVETSAKQLAFWQEKKQGYVKLRQWQEERIQRLRQAVKIIDLICSKILFRLEKTNSHNSLIHKYIYIQSIYIYIYSYFIMKAEKNREVAKIVNKPSNMFEPMFTFYQKTGIPFKDLLTSTKQFDEEFGKKINDYSAYIIKTLLVEFKKMSTEYNTQYINLKEANHRVHTKVIKASKEQETNYQLHCMIFADQEIETVKGKSMMPKLKGKDAKRRDAWLSERMFTDAAHDQLQRVGEYEKFAEQLWTEAKRMEKNRMTAMKKCFEMHTSQHVATFGTQELAYKMLDQIGKISIMSMGNELYGVKHLLDEKDYQYFSKPGEKEKLMAFEDDEFMAFVDKLILDSPKPPESSLSKFEGYLYKSKKNRVFAIVTRDRFFHVLKKEEDTKPYASFDLEIDRVSAYPDFKDSAFIVQKKKKGIFSSSLKVKLLCDSHSEVDAWLNNIDKPVVRTHGKIPANLNLSKSVTMIDTGSKNIKGTSNRQSAEI